MTIGEKVSNYRRAQGLTQEMLVETSGISLRTLQRIEKDNSQPRSHTLKSIAQALNIEFNQLSAPTMTTAKVDKFTTLRSMILLSLVFMAVPFMNIIAPLLLWRKHRAEPIIDSTGRKIISFQILWTFIALPSLLITPLLSHIIAGDVQVGQFPLYLLIYTALVILNIILSIKASISLSAGKLNIFSYIPNLF